MRIFRQAQDKLNICPICVAVSGLWLGLSAGMVWGFLVPAVYLIPTALLMGGTVVGIAYRRDSLRWKTVVIILGMPLAYLALVNLSKAVVIVELVTMFILALLLFVKQAGGPDSENLRKLEKQMEQCC